VSATGETLCSRTCIQNALRVIGKRLQRTAYNQLCSWLWKPVIG
jgi:hypothetical protein